MNRLRPRRRGRAPSRQPEPTALVEPKVGEVERVEERRCLDVTQLLRGFKVDLVVVQHAGRGPHEDLARPGLRLGNFDELEGLRRPSVLRHLPCAHWFTPSLTTWPMRGAATFAIDVSRHGPASGSSGVLHDQVTITRSSTTEATGVCPPPVRRSGSSTTRRTEACRPQPGVAGRNGPFRPHLGWGDPNSVTVAPVLESQKILVAGATGQVAFPVTLAMAEGNEVWATARFSDAEARKQRWRPRESTASRSTWSPATSTRCRTTSTTSSTSP